jgi:phasin family protein
MTEEFPMSRTATVNPAPAKTQETVEKTLKANQAAAEKAVKVGKETAEKALKAGSEVVSKAYDQAVAAAKETVQKTFPQAAAQFEELAGVQRANLEALFAAGTQAMKGVETLSEEVLAFNKKAMDDSVANAKKLFDCKTVQELVEVQTDCACAQFEEFLAHGTKVTDMALKLAGEIAEPLQDRLGRAVEKLGKPLTA